MASIGLAAVGLVIMVASLFAGGGGSAAPSCPAGSSCAVRAQLRSGLTAAQGFYSEQKPPSYAGFTSAKAAGVDPSLPWATSASPAPSQIAVVKVTDTSIVLVGLTSSGQAYCIADKGKSGTVVYGKLAAKSTQQCTGGW
jgi:hypothetical protein